MKKLFPSILLLSGWLFCLSFSIQVYAQSSDEEAVKAVENQRFEAQVKKDLAALEILLGDDLVYNHSSGNTDTKASYIQSIKDGKSVYDAITSEEMKVRVYGKIAVINGICSIKMPTANLRLKYTDVYAKRKGKWQMISWQSLKLVQ